VALIALLGLVLATAGVFLRRIVARGRAI